jgi:hypothetical protein
VNYINLDVSVLHSPEFIGSSPAERGAWLCVLGYCVSQENAGRIAGGLKWKDRQWQQACGVTLREIGAASRLITTSGDDIIVFGYPIEKEEEVRAKRVQAKEAARRRWEAKLGISPDASRNASRITPCNAPADASRNAEGNWNGIGMEGNSGASASALDLNTREASRTLPENINTAQVRLAWGNWLEYWSATIGGGKPMPQMTADAHLHILAQLGPIQAPQAIATAISRSLREPAMPFAAKNQPAKQPVRVQT